MFGIGPMELVLILIVALLVLGPKRMPELARTLGRGLNEFRRASNDLRQSLALDDLQNDLRKGMSGAGSIQKPRDPDDRPAQAGDDLPPGQGDHDPATKGKTQDESGDPKEQGEQSAAAKPHPGELPLDADPHAHHDEADFGGGASETSATSATSDTSKASEASKGSDTPRETSAAAGKPAREATSRSADSALGNVPVGGAPGPTDDRRG